MKTKYLLLYPECGINDILVNINVTILFIQ